MDKFIIKSEFSVERLAYNSLGELFVDRLNTDSEQTCLIDCTLDRRWSKKSVLDSSLNFAYYLINDCEVSKGDIVCFVTNNSDIHAIAIIGVLAAGAVYTSLDEHTSDAELMSIVERFEPTVMVVTDKYYELVRASKNKYTFLKTVLVIGEHHTKNGLSVEEILQRQRRDDIRLPVSVGCADWASLVLSSGSTGQPKAIIRTHGNQLATIEAMNHKETFLLTPDDTMLANGFSHISGQLFLLMSVYGGAKLAIVPLIRGMEVVFQTINKYQITNAFLIPPYLNYLAKNRDQFDHDYVKCLRDLLTGGAPISPSTRNIIRQQFNMGNFRSGFGMSETGFSAATPVSKAKDLDNIQLIGKVLPNTEIKIIDNNGNSLAANCQGQICIRGSQVTPGYLKNETENRKQFTSDGFLRTGDLGYYDENHYFYITGRIKDIIICHGENVLPVELENILQTHPKVLHAAVVGIGHEDLGEVPFAFVQLVVGGNDVSEQSLISYMDSRVNYYKKLRGGLKIVDQFPMTPLNKINKPMLKKLYLA